MISYPLYSATIMNGIFSITAIINAKWDLDWLFMRVDTYKYFIPYGIFVMTNRLAG